MLSGSKVLKIQLLISNQLLTQLFKVLKATKITEKQFTKT